MGHANADIDYICNVALKEFQISCQNTTADGNGNGREVLVRRIRIHGTFRDPDSQLCQLASSPLRTKQRT